MDIIKKENDGTIEVILSGNFTFEDRRRFHDIAVTYPKPGICNIVINCLNLEYMDSTAIGMLLILHENAIKNGVAVKAINVGAKLRPLFEMSALGKLFSVEYLAPAEV